MSQNLTVQKTDFPTLFHIAGGATALPTPFAREILLLECRVAGTSYRPNIAAVEPELNLGAKFRLEREPDNEFDEWAIKIYDARNVHIGYVPKTKNEVLARLLDAGKTLSARLIAKDWQDSWLKLDIEIFLHD